MWYIGIYTDVKTMVGRNSIKRIILINKKVLRLYRPYMFLIRLECNKKSFVVVYYNMSDQSTCFKNFPFAPFFLVSLQVCPVILTLVSLPCGNSDRLSKVTILFLFLFKTLWFLNPKIVK